MGACWSRCQWRKDKAEREEAGLSVAQAQHDFYWKSASGKQARAVAAPIAALVRQLDPSANSVDAFARVDEQRSTAEMVSRIVAHHTAATIVILLRLRVCGF